MFQIRSIGCSSLRVLCVLLWLSLFTGCSSLIRKAAVQSVTGMLAAPGGAGAFASDNDPELVRDALPFVLKTYDILREKDPRNTELAAAAAAAFVQYANAFVHREAAELERSDFDRAARAKERAARLYLRGRDHALAGLDVRHPGFADQLRARVGTADQLTRQEVALTFWAGAGWAGAIAAEPGNMERVAELPVAEALLRRALELDETYEDGAAHELFITIKGSLSEAMGGSPARARRHFERAVALSGGRKASPYVALAESVAVREQNVELFRELLGQALAVNPDAVPAWRLANLLAQEKARWLMERGPELFVEWDESL
ncbi:MAG: hypothetical protein JXB04_03285 [Kiritimatiellae bacterium]|nr:hypothetical protein [Kiritimatiellia bacterium]